MLDKSSTKLLSSTHRLQNERMNNNGFQIWSSDDFYSSIVFSINQLKNILLSCFNSHEPDNIEANDEELSKPHATTDSNAQPQRRAQAPTDAASQLVLGQSLSTTFPAIPVSLQQTDGGLEALTKNFKQCEVWNGPQGNNNQEDQIYYTIEGSAYMISRKPFDPIGRPFNPFGPIQRPIPRLPSSDELADLGFV